MASPSDQLGEGDAQKLSVDTQERGCPGHVEKLTPVATVPRRALALGDSPRTIGEDMAHVRLLAATEVELPPVVVHRATMRVIDGAHRLRAAELRGDATVRVRFFDGTESDAFILAVELNRAHGLPLSLSDRTAAARRIVESHPQWSNRRIAVVTGLSANTVGAIRKCSAARNVQSNTRVGRDGRVRPINGTGGRQRVSELMAIDPTASLRNVAKAAGVSVSTAGDVRARMNRGEPVMTQRQPRSSSPNKNATIGNTAELGRVVQELRRDPSLRFTEAGRHLLCLMEAGTLDQTQWEQLVARVPAHRLDMIARLARECAGAWCAFADRLAGRAESAVHSVERGNGKNEGG